MAVTTAASPQKWLKKNEQEAASTTPKAKKLPPRRRKSRGRGVSEQKPGGRGVGKTDYQQSEIPGRNTGQIRRIITGAAVAADSNSYELSSLFAGTSFFTLSPPPCSVPIPMFCLNKNKNKKQGFAWSAG